MKNARFTLLAAVLLLGFSIGSHAQVSFGEAQLFDDGWQFSLNGGPERTLDLPHDWSVEGIASPDNASCTGYLPGGIGMYRKVFNHSAKPGTKTYIYFEGVYNRSTIWLNGHEIGGRPNGYVSFMYELTPWLKDGENELKVKVDHSRSADSRWYTGSGIYRDVYLVEAPETHLRQWGTSYEAVGLEGRKPVLKAGWAIDRAEGEKGRLEVRIALKDAAGKTVASSKTKAGAADAGSVDLKLTKPHLWNLDDPYLYTIETELWKDGRKVDCNSVEAGLRSIRFDADKGFFLNGKNMKIKGVCMHHDAGALGAVAPKEILERRLNSLKSMGVNAIRLAHNPQAPDLYDLCDRLGLMVMDEISDEWEFPKRKWLKGWNQGEPGFEGTYDFFEEWIEKDLRDMILRDRCHPSIVMWSIGNEVDYPNDPYSHPILDGSSISQPMYGGYKPDAPSAMRIGVIAKKLAAVVHSLDTSRPATGALAGVVMSNETEYPQAVDVVGYNYTEDRYDLDHEKYPGRIIYGSENRPGIQTWRAVTEHDFIAGQFIWTGIDYLGESHAWPSRGMGTGLLDFGAFRKPRGWFQASLWSETPVTYIGTYPVPERPGRWGNFLSTEASDVWNYEPGQKIRVVCYTNAPAARLLLNGREVGEKKAYDSNTGVISWDVPYAEGELVAEGLAADGSVESSYRIVSNARPYELKATADRVEISGKRSLAILTVEVLDDNGNRVSLADNEITCRISGPARLLALESSDNTDMGNFRDSRQRVYHGRLLAYIAGGDEPGTVTVSFSSPLLKGTSVTLENR